MLSPIHVVAGLISLLPLVLGAVSQPRVDSTANAPSRQCGSEISSEKAAEYERRFDLDRTSQILVESETSANAPINVWIHVVAKNRSITGGWVPKEQLNSQMNVLNADYVPTGLKFVLAGVDYTLNQDWFMNGGPQTTQQTQMKARLRKGGAADLNLYSVNFSGEWTGLLGYSTFPVAYSNAPKDDGVVVLYSSLPGGTTPFFNLGRTATHEVGHWVGLYHTFQGGCAAPGDGVSDTPYEATPTRGCPTSKDTCSQAGVDPIHNYMDYSIDSCLNQFTKGQAERMKSQIRIYRGIS
ncbi:hypothetical protein K443DRAFT_96976 [Laccaria amethystina LaAM-08-1]|uniref:Peptidase M43 pregnancy-associated plasma-A domain-containing protein n=1 Tax=Laccaria amethystina LaAM-08-1 TaxID=1095629 RepID=A0A0C9WTN4_9AGAR|nr:hypothetical protein K443DRAFT_96976 [Laccaria amethystina LaAM-08-1]